MFGPARWQPFYGGICYSFSPFQAEGGCNVLVISWHICGEKLPTSLILTQMYNDVLCQSVLDRCWYLFLWIKKKAFQRRKGRRGLSIYTTFKARQEVLKNLSRSVFPQSPFRSGSWEEWHGIRFKIETIPPPPKKIWPWELHFCHLIKLLTVRVPS